MVLSANVMLVYASAKKCTLVEQLKSDAFDVRTFVRSKDADQNVSELKQLISAAQDLV